MIPEFLAELTAHYSTHHLAPSLVLSRLGDGRYYAAVHTFPNGLNSRYIVCKQTGSDLETCVTELRAIWKEVVGAVG